MSEQSMGMAADRELRVLMLEDALADAELCQRELKRAGLHFTMQRVETRQAFETALDEFKPDLIISDFSLPNAFDGLTALELARSKLPEVPFVFVSGTIGEERAVEAMRSGATDYVLKDRLSRLVPIVRRALQEADGRAARKRVEEALRESEEKYRLLWETTNDAVILMDEENRIQYANPAVMKIFGYAPEEVTGREIAMLQPERLRDAHRRGVKRYLETGVRTRDWRSIEVVGLHRDGHQFPVEISFSHMDFGGSLLFGGFMRDITERKQQEQRIARLSRIRAVLTGINSTIVRVTDRDELFREACRIAVEEGGFALAWIGILDRQTLEVRPTVWQGQGRALLENLRSSVLEDTPIGQGTTAMAIRSRRAVVVNDIANDPRVIKKDGPLAHGFLALIVLPLLVEEEVFGVFKLYASETGVFDQEEVRLLEELAGDVSFALDHMAKAERLNYLAYYDSLTGLPNRHLFYDRVNQLTRAASDLGHSVAMVVFDVERFRSINEAHGMAAGDTLLKQVAQRLAGTPGETAMICRIAGDCFALAVGGVASAERLGHVLQEQILVALNAPFSIGEEELRLPVKVGIAVYPADGKDAAALFTNAEAALKKAKQSGDRFLFYAPQMNARVAEQLRLENELRRAVLEEQFVLHYQPRIELATGRVSGLEALIRWAHPERGLVLPGEFIPILERTSLILEAGRWALKRAALDHSAWRAKGLEPPRIAVNVSAIQLRRKDFVEDVRTALAAAGGSAEHIDVEITESMLMEDIEGNIEKLKAVQAMGMQVALDDFGTGYSSLSYLARLPINSLKIDRSFISQMVKSPEQMAIVSAIVPLARALNLKVAAEGVETGEQANLLRLLRCDEAQGFHFHRPLSPAEVERLIT